MTQATQQRKDESISIILPTFRRPAGVKVALKSLEKQKSSVLDFDVIVVDNDPYASARNCVRIFASKSSLNIQYLHDPNPGVANARNTALKAAKGRYLAFLDDDQEALENWLQNLMHTSRAYNAALVFGPCFAKIKQKSKYHAYYKNFFSRIGEGLETGLIEEVFGCGNSLIDTHLCLLPTPAFDVSMNETGGEDDLLFTTLQEQNIKIAWSKNAKVYEHVPKSRTTPNYIKARSFAFGQSPTEQCAESFPRDYAGISKWMLVGAVQYCLYAPLTLLTKLLGRPSYIKFLAKSYEGIGKIFWFDAFSPKLYGAASLKKSS